MIVMIIFFMVRIVVTILYATVDAPDLEKNVVTGTSTGCCLSIFLIILIDYYKFRIWWYYKPNGDQSIFRCCCCIEKYHPSHTGYLPEPLFGKNRDPNMYGNEPCPSTYSDCCENLSLRHIAIYHSFDFQPQERFNPSKHKTYFGFHQTTLASAIGIAYTGFRISEKPPQMLGFGVYFALSFRCMVLCWSEFEESFEG